MSDTDGWNENALPPREHRVCVPTPVGSIRGPLPGTQCLCGYCLHLHGSRQLVHRCLPQSIRSVLCAGESEHGRIDEEQIAAALAEMGIEAEQTLEIGGWKTTSQNVAVSFVPFPPIQVAELLEPSRS